MNLFERLENLGDNIRIYGPLEGIGESILDGIDSFGDDVEKGFDKMGRVVDAIIDPKTILRADCQEKSGNKSLEAGDIIAVPRDLYYHYAVYIGDRRVIHFAAENGDFGGDITVHEAPFSEFLRDSDSFEILEFGGKRGQVTYHDGNQPLTSVGLVTTIEDSRPFIPLGRQIRELIKDYNFHLYTPSETVARAKEVANAFKSENLMERFWKRHVYHLASNNCEHFAIWCKTGVHESSQVEQLLKLFGI